MTVFRLIPCVYPNLSNFLQPLNRANFYSMRDFSIFSRKMRCSQVHMSQSKDQVKSSSEPAFTNFQDVIKLRQHEAKCSVLIRLLSKEDIPFVVDICKQFGNVKKLIHHVGESGNMFLLTEFVQEDAVHKMLKHCQYINVSSTFPLYSRFISYERKNKKKSVSTTYTDISDAPEARKSKLNPPVVSKLIQDIYDKEKLKDKSIRLRFLFNCMLNDSLSGMFPYSTVVPFGSTVNGFGKEGCDLDVAISLYSQKVKKESEMYFLTRTYTDERIVQQCAVRNIGNLLRMIFPGVSLVQTIQHARVPIVKFNHEILNLKCDISVNNMAAVYMSELLHFCGEIDERVRPLVFTVKKWAKEANITYETPGSWITNFSLTLLVIFFLQNRPVPILPALEQAAKFSDYPDELSVNGIEYIEDHVKWKSLAANNVENLESLLEEFLYFLAKYPFKNNSISIMSGHSHSKNDYFPIFIQYPMEEDANVTKNMTVAELLHLSQVAGFSLQHFEHSKRKNLSKAPDLMSLLGIPELTKMHSERSEKIDINQIYLKSK